MQGRRLPVPTDGQHPMPEQPGDYCGPLMFNGQLTVFFLKPNARDPDAPKIARAIHHVTSPPHTFHEEPDGSLTIRASLGDNHPEVGQSDGWHGYLTRGVWEKC